MSSNTDLFLLPDRDHYRISRRPDALPAAFTALYNPTTLLKPVASVIHRQPPIIFEIKLGTTLDSGYPFTKGEKLLWAIGVTGYLVRALSTCSTSSFFQSPFYFAEMQGVTALDKMASSTPSPTASAAASTSSSRRPPRKSTLTQQQKNQKRQRATQDQLATLEVEFNKNPTPTAAVRERIAQDINMTERSVQIWFQNRFVLHRARGRSFPRLLTLKV